MSKTPALQNPKTKIGKAMAPILSGIETTQKAIVAKTQTYHDAVIYDIVGMGLWFLKAKAKLNHGKFTEFKLAMVANLGVSERTIRNYMQAATNAGLTAKSEVAAVDEMRQREALHGAKPGDLYKLPAAETKDDKDAGGEMPEPQQLVLDLFHEWSEKTNTLVTSRDAVDPENYEQITNQLHAALCKWTGCDWTPREQGSDGDASVLAADMEGGDE